MPVRILISRASAPMLLAVLLALLLGHAPVEAQRASPPQTFIAIAETFPDLDARAVLVRERGRDIVVLNREEATIDALAMSLVALERVREQHPSVEPGRGQLIPITGYAVTRPPTGDHLRRLQGVLDRLETAPTTSIGSFGPGRWIRFAHR